MDKLPPDGHKPDPVFQYRKDESLFIILLLDLCSMIQVGTFHVRMQGQATDHDNHDNPDGSGDEDHGELDDNDPFIEHCLQEQNADKRPGSEEYITDDDKHQGQLSCNSGESEGERESDKDEDKDTTQQFSSKQGTLKIHGTIDANYI